MPRSLLRPAVQLRLYRVFELFDMLEYNMVLGQFSLVMLRNNMVSARLLHGLACDTLPMS